MMRKLSSVAKLLGRNFSSTTWKAPILHERLFWKSIEITKNLALGSLGLVSGYGIAFMTFHSRSQYVIAQEERALDGVALTKELIRKKDERLKVLEKKREEAWGKKDMET